MSFLSRIMVLKSQAHFSAGVYNRFGGPSAGVAIEGTRKKKSGQAKSRVGLLILGFMGVYVVIGGRLVEYAMKGSGGRLQHPASRPADGIAPRYSRPAMARC